MDSIEIKKILDLFLNISISDSTDVFNMFSALPGAVFVCGDNDFERFLYIPGSREDRVLLLAHTDTFWDIKYGKRAKSSIVFENGIYRSGNDECGIGADDRAGCAMLWALKDSGHSLLLLDGEEHGKIGAKFLKKHNPMLFSELNRHQFMMEFDWQGTGGALYNQVDYTNKFVNYISDNLGFYKEDKKGGCDLQILTKRICGVNIGAGYHNQHKSSETLVLEDWQNSYEAISKFLKKTHPRFRISKPRRALTILKRIKNKFKKLF